MKSCIQTILFLLFILGVILLVRTIRTARGEEVVAARETGPSPVQCMLLERRSYAVTESFYGLIEAKAQVDMAFQIGGRVVRLGPTGGGGLNKNDPVMPGDILAALDPTRYLAALERTRAQTEQANAERAAAQALVYEAQVRVRDARDVLTRVHQLLENGAATERESETANLTMEIAKLQLDHSRARLASASAACQVLVAAKAIAESNAHDATIRAPMAGLVSAVRVELGQSVKAGEPAVTIVDLSTVKLVVGVVEQKSLLLETGQKVSVDVRALAVQSGISDHPGLVTSRRGVVTVVPLVADPVTGLFNVEIELSNDDMLLRPGMIGKATVTITERQAVAVPLRAAVQTDQATWAFFVSRGDGQGADQQGGSTAEGEEQSIVVRRVGFKPLASEDDYYLVADLPDWATLLVVEGHHRLTDGQPVTLIAGDSVPRLAEVSGTGSQDRNIP